MMVCQGHIFEVGRICVGFKIACMKITKETYWLCVVVQWSVRQVWSACYPDVDALLPPTLYGAGVAGSEGTRS